MATATAPAVSREILLDRWHGLMEWERNGGHASAEYVALATVLGDLIEKVAGQETIDFDAHGEAVGAIMDGLGPLVADAVLAGRFAR